MPTGEPPTEQNGREEDELEITDLRPHRGYLHGEDARRWLLSARAWQRLVLVLSLVLLVTLLLVGLLSGGGTLRGLIGAPASSSPTVLVSVSTEMPTAALPPTPDLPWATPTALPGVTGVPALGSAPASCGGEAPALTHAGPPAAGEAIGHVPVRVGGFTGPYATLRLGPSATSFGWTAAYTRYGWPAGIFLVVRSDVAGPVTLTGWNPHDGHALWFGFVEAGVWGAPTPIVPVYTFDLAHLAIPAGGSDATGAFWYGYVFLPGAGCYVLAASWPGGGWQLTVSAGR